MDGYSLAWNQKSKNPNDVLATKHKFHERQCKRATRMAKPRDEERSRGDEAPSNATKNNSKKQYPKGNSKIQVVEKVKFNFGKAANPNRENGVSNWKHWSNRL
jgi:hypothetical protein